MEKSKEELRIVVTPYEGLYNRWTYRIEKRVQIFAAVSDTGYWGPWFTFLDQSYNDSSGRARTKEKALLKGRKRASAYCERKNLIRAKYDRIKKNTTIEEFKCPGVK